MSRKAKGYIILGYNGTGKSTFAKQLLLKELEKDNRALVITPDPVEWQNLTEIDIKDVKRFKGAAKIVYSEEVLQAVFNDFRNGLLIMDDYRVFDINANSKEAAIMKNFFRRKRQKMLDIAVVAHGFTEVVPTALFTLTDYYVLFETKDSIKKLKEYLLNYEILKKHQEEINKISPTVEPEKFMTYHRIIKK